jgi:hypothetical protein
MKRRRVRPNAEEAEDIEISYGSLLYQHTLPQTGAGEDSKASGVY